jgi:hypothetical protein
LTMIRMTLNILLIFMTWRCSTATKKLQQIILGIPKLLEPHKMDTLAEDDYVLALQVQTIHDHDDLSDQNLSRSWTYCRQILVCCTSLSFLFSVCYVISHLK